MDLHKSKVLYRDLKPENVMINSQGNVKLIDFGFSKILEKGRTFTTIGSPEYLAPEVLMGKGYKLEVDWWGLGILLYELYCGQPPFHD